MLISDSVAHRLHVALFVFAFCGSKTTIFLSLVLDDILAASVIPALPPPKIAISKY